MAEYTTKHAIGDLVYLADKNGIDRDVIKSIKITGVKEEKRYGFKTNNPSGLYSFWSSWDDHKWYKTSELFLDKESALAHHENLKVKYEAEQAKEEQERKGERRKELQEELKELDQK